MSKFHDDPVKPEGRVPPSEMRRRERAADARGRHMVHRFLAAEAAAKAGHRSVDRVRAVEKLFAEGLLGDWMPTRPTICALADAYDSGQTSPDAYFVAGAGGRPRAVLAEVWQDWLKAEVESHGVLETCELITRLRLVAPPSELPKDDALRRIVNEFRGGLLEQSSRLHGRTAAEVDGTPHETLPYENSLDCLTEDELVLPVWQGLWSEALERFLSTLLFVALVLDYVSRAIVASHLCDPRRRRGPEGQQLFTGVDASDIAAVFLKATRPELAPSCTLPYTGFEAAHIRLDGASTHRRWFNETGSHLPTRVHLLASYRPYRNGVHERMGLTAKRAFRALFIDVAGNVEEYIPTDRIGENQHQARKAAAATDRRVRRRIPIDPQDLLRPEEIERIVLPKIIDLYNKHMVHSALGTTPYNAFMSKLPRRQHLHPSGPMVRALPSAAVTVNGTGVVLQRDNVRESFSAKVDGRYLPLGSTHVVHVHPQLAGVWLEDGPTRELKFLPTLADAARLQSARYIAQSRSALTGGLSDQAQRLADQRAVEARGVVPTSMSDGAPAPASAASNAASGDTNAKTAPTTDKKRAKRKQPSPHVGAEQLNPDRVPQCSPVPDADPSSDAPDLCQQMVAGTMSPRSAEDIWLTATVLTDQPGSASNDAAQSTASPDSAQTGAPSGTTETPRRSSDASPPPAPRTSGRAPAALWLTRAETVPAPLNTPPSTPPTQPSASPQPTPTQPGTAAA